MGVQTYKGGGGIKVNLTKSKQKQIIGGDGFPYQRSTAAPVNAFIHVGDVGHPRVGVHLVMDTVLVVVKLVLGPWS